MSNELHAFAPLAKTLYAILLNSTGAVWNGTEFETIDGRFLDLYAIPLTGALQLGIYLADMPAVAQGVYSYAIYEQAGGSVATSDALWDVVSIAWSGTAEIVPASSNGLTAQQTADAVYKLAPTAGPPATGSTGALLEALSGSIGPGSSTGYYTDTVDDGTSPLDGVRVQLYTAANRVGLAYEAYTDALGVFEMWPDPGTYRRWLDLAGYSGAQDVAVEVTEL